MSGRHSVIQKAFKTVAVISCLALGAGAAEAQSLRGTRASMDRQNAQARAHDFTFLRDSRHVQQFVSAGLLVRLSGNRNYELHSVSYPYARPEVKLFVERLSSQFRAACGEKLVITSLTRPKSGQPRNASSRSVHPTGMALDIRRHNTPGCRSWLERVLLSLEGSGVLEVSVERNPPHYHMALFPDPYRAYVDRITAAGGNPSSAGSTVADTHTVSRNETLWRIARRYGTTPRAIQSANDLPDTTIYPGQQLRIPATR